MKRKTKFQRERRSRNTEGGIYKGKQHLFISCQLESTITLIYIRVPLVLVFLKVIIRCFWLRSFIWLTTDLFLQLILFQPVWFWPFPSHLAVRSFFFRNILVFRLFWWYINSIRHICVPGFETRCCTQDFVPSIYASLKRKEKKRKKDCIKTKWLGWFVCHDLLQFILACKKFLEKSFWGIFFSTVSE